MRLSQVGHVDVIADTGAGGVWVIYPVDFYSIALARRSFHHNGQEMRFRIVNFAELSLRIRPSRVEVAQNSPPQIICPTVPIKGPFNKELGFAVRINR